MLYTCQEHARVGHNGSCQHASEAAGVQHGIPPQSTGLSWYNGVAIHALIDKWQWDRHKWSVRLSMWVSSNIGCQRMVCGYWGLILFSYGVNHVDRECCGDFMASRVGMCSSMYLYTCSPKTLLSLIGPWPRRLKIDTQFTSDSVFISSMELFLHRTSIRHICLGWNICLGCCHICLGWCCSRNISW